MCCRLRKRPCLTLKVPRESVEASRDHTRRVQGKQKKLILIFFLSGIGNSRVHDAADRGRQPSGPLCSAKGRPGRVSRRRPSKEGRIKIKTKQKSISRGFVG